MGHQYKQYRLQLLIHDKIVGLTFVDVTFGNRIMLECIGVQKYSHRLE